jgi:hypothetical protein
MFFILNQYSYALNGYYYVPNGINYKLDQVSITYQEKVLQQISFQLPKELITVDYNAPLLLKNHQEFLYDNSISKAYCFKQINTVICMLQYDEVFKKTLVQERLNTKKYIEEKFKKKQDRTKYLESLERFSSEPIGILMIKLK